MKGKSLTVRQMMSIVEGSIEARQAKFEHDAQKPTGPLFTFLVGAGFSVTAGLPSVNHLVVALEKFKTNRKNSWASIFDETIDISLNERGFSGPELTDYYFQIMGDVLPLPQARHDFITAAIQWASSKRVQMNLEGILLATMLMAGTGKPVPMNKRKKNRHWMAQSFARHVFTTNFDEVLPNTFYYGNHPVDIIDKSGSRTINAAAEYPTVVYLHGRHLHFDLKNTKTELHAKRNTIVDPSSDLFEGFKSLLKNTGLIVIGYAGAKDKVTSYIMDALDDPDSLPYGLWWSAYRDETALHSDVRSMIDSNERAFYLDPGKDGEQLMRLLSQEAGIDDAASINHWKERLQYVSGEVNRFLDRASYNLRQYQLEIVQAPILGIESEINKVLGDWESIHYHVLDHSDKEFVVDILTQVGRLMVFAGHVEDAKTTYQEALDLLEKLGNYEKLASTLLAYGELLIIIGEIDSAVEIFLRAKEYYVKIDKVLGIAEAGSFLADIYLLQNKRKDANQLYLEANKMYSKHRYDVGIGRNLSGLGYLELLNDSLDKSLHLFEQALAIQEKDGNEKNICSALRGLSRVYLAMDNIDESEKCIDRAISISDENGLKREYVKCMIQKSELLLKSDQEDQAYELVLKAEEVNQKYYEQQSKFNIEIFKIKFKLIANYDERVTKAVSLIKEIKKKGYRFLELKAEELLKDYVKS